MRRNAKVDRGHFEIGVAVQDAGYSFLSLAALGRGKPDALIGADLSRTFLIEIKSPDAKGARKTLNAAQSEFFSTWHGEKHVVTSIPQVLDLCRRFPILCGCQWCVSQRS